MRVVSGSLRGRVIKAVPGNTTRPTLDKVKESVFNILGQYFSKGIGLDLFAGSGNLGIEAISRGLEHCIFVDYDHMAIRIIKENLNALNILEKCEVYKMDAFKALSLFKSNNYRFDYVFIDPPYKSHKINEILMLLENYDLLNDEAYVICESLKEDELIETYNKLHLKKVYYYGISKITIYEKYGDNHE